MYLAKQETGKAVRVYRIDDYEMDFTDWEPGEKLDKLSVERVMTVVKLRQERAWAWPTPAFSHKRLRKPHAYLGKSAIGKTKARALDLLKNYWKSIEKGVRK